MSFRSIYIQKANNGRRRSIRKTHFFFLFTYDHDNFALRLVTRRSFSVGIVFPYEILFQGSPKFDIIAAILNGAQQPGRVYVMSFRPKDFCSKWLPTSLLFTTLGYGSSEAVLFWAKHASNSENESSEDNRLEKKKKRKKEKKKKKLFADFMKQSELQVFLLPAKFASDEIPPHKHDLATKYSWKWRSRKPILSRPNFFWIAGTLTAETSVSGKTECYRWRQKKINK